MHDIFDHNTAIKRLRVREQTNILIQMTGNSSLYEALARSVKKIRRA